MQYQIAGYYSFRIIYTLNVIHFICYFKHYSIKLIILFILFSNGNLNPVTKKQQVTTTKATRGSKRHQRTTTISPAEMQESQTRQSVDVSTDQSTSASTDVTTKEVQRYFLFEKWQNKIFWV